MPLPSPTCTVNTLATPQDVTVNSTINIALANVSGVGSWAITCVGTDENNSVAAINATLVVNGVAKTATATAPAGAGAKLIFKSTVGVNNVPGLDANGASQAALSTTFAVNILTGGLRVIAQNEAFEQDAVFGWINEVNKGIRSTGGAGTLAGDVTGTIGANIVSAISGASPIPITPATLQWVSASATPTITQAALAAATGASGSNGQTLQVVSQAGQSAINSGNNGGAGGQRSITAGNGGSSGLAIGGNGGPVAITTGTGGSSGGTAANSSGGNCTINLGAPGTGGSGAAGGIGQFLLKFNSANGVVVDSAVTSVNTHTWVFGDISSRALNFQQFQTPVAGATAGTWSFQTSPGGASTTGGGGGPLTWSTGAGGNSTGAFTAGPGGLMQWISGTGGNAPASGTSAGGQGGDFVWTSGNGGLVPTGNAGTTGRGGNMTWTTGNGGTQNGSGNGGNAGSFSFIGGTGGTNAITGANGSGGGFTVTCGAAGSGGSSGSGGNVVLTAGGAGAGVAGNVQLTSTLIYQAVQTPGLAISTPSGIGGVSGQPIVWNPVTILNASGTVTLSNAQMLSPCIRLTGTLGSATTLVFPNSAGFWFVDISSLAFGGFTLAFKSGTTTTATVSSATTITNLIPIITNGSNTIAANV